jgi:hypothetical protein
MDDPTSNKISSSYSYDVKLTTMASVDNCGLEGHVAGHSVPGAINIRLGQGSISHDDP